MLWSKGIDVAVEAVRLARAKGAAIELSLYGAPDPSNPKAIPEKTLKAWSAEPGIAWHGATRDIAGVWREHHVACLPSRGGEGLPRTLLEAAACGRAIVTTDVPGCRTLVRHDVEGLLVPPGCRSLVRGLDHPGSRAGSPRPHGPAAAPGFLTVTRNGTSWRASKSFTLHAGLMIADPVAFILAETRLRPGAPCTGDLLHVADEATELWQKTEEELGETTVCVLSGFQLLKMRCAVRS